MTIETYIRNLPVFASGEVYPAEPNVGLSSFVEDLTITLLNGDSVPGELSDEDEQRIVDLLVQAYNEPPC